MGIVMGGWWGGDVSGLGDLDPSKYTFTLPDGQPIYMPPTGSRAILWGSPESGAFADMMYPGHREAMIGASSWNMRGHGIDTTLLMPTLSPETRSMLGPAISNAMEAQLGYLFMPGPRQASHTFGPGDTNHFHLVAKDSNARYLLGLATQKLDNSIKDYQAAISGLTGEDAARYALENSGSINTAMSTFFSTVSQIPGIRIVYHTQELTASAHDPVRFHQFNLTESQEIPWDTVPKPHLDFNPRFFDADMNDLPGFESEPSSGKPDPDMIIQGYYPQGYGMGVDDQPVNQFNIWPSLALTADQAAFMNQNITITVLDADHSVW